MGMIHHVGQGAKASGKGLMYGAEAPAGGPRGCSRCWRDKMSHKTCEGITR